MFPGLDLYCADPAQHLITAGEDLHDLLYDLSGHDLSVNDLRDVCTRYLVSNTAGHSQHSSAKSGGATAVCVFLLCLGVRSAAANIHTINI